MEIVLKNVTYRYRQKTVFDKFNLQIEGPKIIGIMGKSKTEFLKLIDAIYLPTKGTISIGKDVLSNKNLTTYRRKVALVTENAREQFFEDTVAKEMRFLVDILKCSIKDIDKKMEEALKIVGLNHSYLDRSIMDLSSGERKLVQIAVSLIYNPKVILLDEPLADLDYQTKKNLLRLLKMLKHKYKKIIIIASNDSNFFYSFIEELIIIDDKKIAMQGSSNKLFKDKIMLEKYNIDIPYLIEFTSLAKEKKVRLSYHTDIRDIIKDIYKHV